MRVKLAKLAEILVGMGNAEGGVIVIGLSDRMIEGVDAESQRVNELRQTHMQHTNPPVKTETAVVSCVNSQREPDHLLVLTVRAGEAVHATKSDVCFLRVGDETRRLTFHQRQELQYDKGYAQFDSTPVADALPTRSREVMEYIREAGGLSTGDVAERLGMSKPAAAARLHALRDAGYVEWVGTSSRDPRAYWRLASD